MSVLVRFAPSPTGRLHVGNVRAALFNWLFAHKEGGKFLLRSDDTDLERSTKAFEDAIQEDLAWLGLTHDEFARQSERFSVYDAVSEGLKERGLLYPCYETAEELDRKRKLQRARGLPPVYDRAALNLTETEMKRLEDEGRTPHWRFKLAQAPVAWDDMIRGQVTLDTATISDPVLIREDGQYLYTLPSCIDDVDFEVTHIIRGEDHVTNTAAQIEVFRAIHEVRGGGEMPVFGHHSLLVGKDGEGLSKRLGSLAIGQMREDGIEPQAITSLLARLGTSDPVEPVIDMEVLAQGFDVDRIGRAPARFDMDELRAVNAKVLHLMPYEREQERLEGMGVSEALWTVVRGNLETLADAAGWKDVTEGQITPDIAEEDREFCAAAAEHVPAGDLTAEDWSAFVGAVKGATGRKGKGLFMPLRKALTGRSSGPEMADLFPLIGSEKAKARLSGEAA
ncbi:glutamate--tRNA ligase [Parvularcula dongshanensis]|uniref:Glutamate--tRNA ligase n=1 Tax=Parvularcula dongshanensis TaxID=1173995 RepID=A0A840I3G7_9PROT|nr:glutamate--tRNA ligase [Parvularcula dongshanensis]MBB4658821.1 glutamyl-tRNA synthetase [Parvularcula dongshanensis]